MANFIFFTFLLFFILPVSFARLWPLNPVPRNSITGGGSGGADFLNSEVDPIIRLPSQVAEKLPEKEIGPNELTESLPEKEIGPSEKKIGFKGTPERVGVVIEIGNKGVVEILPEKKIGPPEKKIGFKGTPERVGEVIELGNKRVVENSPEKKIGPPEKKIGFIGTPERVGEVMEMGNKRVVEISPEKEIGNKMILPEKENRGSLVVVDNLPEKEIGNNTVAAEKMPEKEIGNKNNTVVDNNPPEKEIGNKNKLVEKLPGKEIRATSKVVEKLPEKENGVTTAVVENLPEKDIIGDNEIDEKPARVVDESLFDDFAEILDMMLPEMKTGDNEELPEKTAEIDEKSSESESGGMVVESLPTTVPLTRIVKFRPPLDRHFRLKWRRSPRPCHHLHHRHHHHHLFPYTGDMLIPTGENGDFDPAVILHRHHRFHHRHRHHHDHNDEDNNDDEESASVFERSARFGEEKFKKHFHHDDHEDENEYEHPDVVKRDLNFHKNDHKDNGLFQRIRKMLIF